MLSHFLRVLHLEGLVGEVGIGKTWRVIDVKQKLERLLDKQSRTFPAREMILCYQEVALANGCEVSGLKDIEANPNLAMLRRDKEARGLEDVTKDWKAIKASGFPKVALQSKEVILEVMRQSDQAFRHAHPSLLSDDLFLEQACELREQAELQPEVRKVILEVLSEDPFLQQAEQELRGPHPDTWVRNIADVTWRVY